MTFLDKIYDFFSAFLRFLTRHKVLAYYGIFMSIAFGRCLLDRTPLTYVFEQPLYEAVVVVWWFSIEQGINNKRIRNCFRIIAISFLFMLFAQSMRYDFLWNYKDLSRFCWYIYYVPTTIVPLMAYYVSWNIGRADYENVDRKQYFLLIPALVLLAGILTNDLHELAFKFDPAYPISQEVYTYGPLYYAVFAWFILVFLAAIILMIIRCRIPGINKNLWKVFLTLSIAVVFEVMSLLGYNPKVANIVLFHYPEVLIFCIITTYESMINIGLIQSNSQYKRFFEQSSLMAQIVDYDGNVVLSSAKANSVEQRVENDYSANIDYKLQFVNIRGGKFYWVDDISEINRLNREISEITDRLKEGNELKVTENKILEDEAKIQTISKLFDEIYIETSSQVEKVFELLDDAKDDEDFKSQLAIACLYNVYIKRQSNLVILGEQNDKIALNELYLSIKEMLEYVQLLGVKTKIICNTECSISSLSARQAFRFVEETISYMLPDARMMFVNVDVKENDGKKQLVLRILLDNATRLPDAREDVTISVDGNSATIVYTQDTINIDGGEC